MIKELEQKAITIKTYEKTIRELAQTPASKAQVDRLTETHCVGLYVATAFVAMTGRDMDRFEKPRDIGPWLGLTPKQDRSGVIDRRCHVTKAGSALMRRLLVEIARSCLRAKSINTDLKAKGLRLSLLGVKHTSCVGQRKAAIAKTILPLTFVLIGAYDNKESNAKGTGMETHHCPPPPRFSTSSLHLLTRAASLCRLPFMSTILP